MEKRDKLDRRESDLLKSLIKSFKSDSEEIQEVLRDIKELLGKANKKIEQLPENLFFANVAQAAPPVAPDLRRIVENIFALGIRLRRLQEELRDLVVGLATLIQFFAGAGGGAILSIFNGFQIAFSRVLNEIREVRALLALAVAELFAI
jgi:ABC-type transporter Mla subunit MlaD